MVNKIQGLDIRLFASLYKMRRSVGKERYTKYNVYQCVVVLVGLEKAFNLELCLKCKTSES